MDRSSVLLLVIILLVSISWAEGMRCREEEREALLDLQKAASKIVLSDGQKDMVTWFKWDEQDEEDCCHWQGVRCHPASGRVTQLRIPATVCRSIFFGHMLYCSYACGRLPASLSRLESLEVLDVRGGCFSGAWQHIFSSLTNLSHLDLSSNPFLSLLDLPLLPRLIYLNFSNVGRTAVRMYFPAQRFLFRGPMNLSKLVASLPNLEYLDLGNNEYLQGALIPEQIGSLQRLVHLDLSGNLFDDPVPWPSLANLSQLSHLGLPDDMVWPEASSVHWQCNWKALESLSCEGVRFASTNMSFPFCLHHPPVVTKLKHLSFSYVDGSIGPLLRSLSLANASLSLQTLSLPGNALWEFEAVDQYSKRPAWLHALHTPFLEVLDLSHNALSGIPFWLPHLPLLHSLDMSGNNLARFPPGLELLPSLKSLDISYNLLKGPIYRLQPSNLSQMWESLTLSNNEITGALPPFLLNPSLWYLDVSNNHLSSVLPLDSLGNMSSLAYLDLSYNSFTGVVPLSIGTLHNIQNLYLSSNSLMGEIPLSIGNLSSLAFLSLSDNSLRGDIPLCIGNMSSLVGLDLSSNHLSGTIPFSIGNLSSLQTLRLSENSFTGSIPTSVFQNSLFELDLAGNQLAGSLVPYCNLQNCAPLGRISVSDNNLSGSLAMLFDAFQNFPFLVDLDLSNNSFSGNLLFPAFLNTCKQFVSLDISENQIFGEIPKEISNCSNLSYLDLSRNYLSGSIPRELGHLWGLQILHLSSNNLVGALPMEIGNLSSLIVLSISNNSLGFGIPASLGKLQKLFYLALHNNKFNGGLPTALQNCSFLGILDLSNNQLSGGIPEWIKGENFAFLQVLMLSNNYFQSSTAVLVSLVQNLTNLQILVMANNCLSGSIPSNVNRLGAMRHYDLVYSNQLESPLILDSVIIMKGVYRSLEQYYSQGVTSMDLSSNRLEGEIPGEIGALKGLHSLNLSRNLLNGSIPRNLADLARFQLESLDLSNNQLTGGIPSEFCSSFVEVLNVSHNRLQGTISQSCTQLCTFDASCYAGNDGLLYECDHQPPNKTEETHVTLPSYPLHRITLMVAELQKRVSLAGWGIGHILGFLLMGLFLHHRDRVH